MTHIKNALILFLEKYSLVMFIGLFVLGCISLYFVQYSKEIPGRIQVDTFELQEIFKTIPIPKGDTLYSKPFVFIKML